MIQHKRFATTVLMTSALLSGAMATTAQAAEPPAMNPGGMGHQFRGRGGHGQFMEQNLANLHTALKLTAAQEPAWTTWSQAMTAQKGDWQARRKAMEAAANQPVIARMESKLTWAKEHQTKLEERIAATKTFYNVLSPEQQQIFDTQFKLRPEGKWRMSGQEDMQDPAE